MGKDGQTINSNLGSSEGAALPYRKILVLKKIYVLFIFGCTGSSLWHVGSL